MIGRRRFFETSLTGVVAAVLGQKAIGYHERYERAVWDEIASDPQWGVERSEMSTAQFDAAGEYCGSRVYVVYQSRKPKDGWLRIYKSFPR